MNLQENKKKKKISVVRFQGLQSTISYFSFILQYKSLSQRPLLSNLYMYTHSWETNFHNYLIYIYFWSHFLPFVSYFADYTGKTLLIGLVKFLYKFGLPQQLGLVDFPYFLDLGLEKCFVYKFFATNLK